MENNHDIDKKFNEASQSAEEPTTFLGFDKVWAKVEEKLDKKEDKKKIIPLWFSYGIAASLIIGLGAFYFINKKEVVDISKPHLVQNTVSPKVNNIQKIDSVVKSNIEKEIALPEIKNNSETLAYEDTRVSSVNNSNYVLENKPNKAEVYQSGKISQEIDTLTGKSIEEVVIVGYRSTTKQSAVTSTSAIVSLQNIETKRSKRKQGNLNSSPSIAMAYGNQTDMNGYINPTRPNANVMNIAQGQLSGVNITTGNGQPGSSPQVLIRGIGSLNGNTKPLYVINGIAKNSDELYKINPNTIESMEVLKDASATVLYGNRGVNGVIIIKTKKLSRKERKALEKIKKVQDSIYLSKQIQQNNSEEYDAFVENPFELTKNQSVSTFSIDVDNAAYSNVRRMINNGEKVNKNAVRIEEMINYFKYNYAQPQNNQPFSIDTEYNTSPWNPKHKLLKIGLQGKNIPMDKLPSSNFVFLIDVSGSMNEPNKLPLLKSSFKVLLDQLRPQDKVGIVVYAGSAGMILPPTSAKEKVKILSALENLQAGGSTAGGAGIELAYKLAQENFIKGGNNRVIIATDGDFNVGTSSTGDLGTLIEEKRKSGVFLTCLGFGMGNFKDNRMETLADKGNGNYAYIDNMQEANKFLGKEFAGSMYAIAKDVKIQIEFNPKFVKSYRLIGYENRKLRNEDFTNDKIDAGELGSGHTVTALYEVIPSNINSEFLPKDTDLKYTKNTSDDNFGDELAMVKFRYKKPDGDTSSEIVQLVKNSNESISSASSDFKFASSVAWFGLVLRDSKLINLRDLTKIEELAKQGKNKDDEGYRSEFIRLVESYKAIQK
ncbi:hypothetical protein AR438_12185 [Chryseobacterium aquaticum]|uniref:VWFA domain-containing protein n=1 Tax=Chryseobacterium aquaticum TaxID=452084 RepID=A0A0Q3HRA5_9FLAO|nr:VWA domain-containing protein [Chryseobacterium aquaticum]KQK25280.1 hypothetical protein AR438_12185 [Chryseobacterium aquaticum]